MYFERPTILPARQRAVHATKSGEEASSVCVDVSFHNDGSSAGLAPCLTRLPSLVSALLMALGCSNGVGLNTPHGSDTAASGSPASSAAASTGASETGNGANSGAGSPGSGSSAASGAVGGVGASGIPMSGPTGVTDSTAGARGAPMSRDVARGGTGDGASPCTTP